MNIKDCLKMQYAKLMVVMFGKCTVTLSNGVEVTIER
jgi:hypothetical protein